MGSSARANILYEISGSADDVNQAPLPLFLPHANEKSILIDPNRHVYGAYNASGKLIRWGIATTGSNRCPEANQSCRTKTGIYRIFSIGDETCTSNKYPLPDGGAPMPFCMFFSGGQAIHGSDQVNFGNDSHGCVRIHRIDAKWLHDHFVNKPEKINHYLGTKIIIKPYTQEEYAFYPSFKGCYWV